MWRKTILATALLGAGLASTTGAAFAGESDHGHEGQGTSSHEQQQRQGGDDCRHDVAAANGDDSSQTGILNVDDVQTVAPVNACNNNVPVNALGVQVPVQDVAADVPILSGAGADGGNSATS